MSSPSYVWEKMYVAIDCLCREGSFVKRLENATASALIRLENTDLTGDLAEDLKFILAWTRDNIAGGKLQNEPNELQRKELVEKMLHVMLETHEK
jgi:hypothetical protein